MIEEHSAADSSVSLLGGTVHVIATSVDGTREALEAATTLACGLSGRVVVFVRRVAPDAHSLGRARDLDSAEAGLRRLIDSYTPRPHVLSCVCERAIDVVQLFQRPGLVVIGGETRWWWPTAEQRLARALTRLGRRDPAAEHADLRRRRGGAAIRRYQGDRSPSCGDTSGVIDRETLRSEMS
jgi:hypothetical protein